MLKRAMLAVIVAIVTGLVVYFVGLMLVAGGGNISAVGQAGMFFKGAAVFVGILAGLWFYLTGQTPA